MKSFNQHLNEKREELKEDPLDDLTDLLWVGAAGAGLWGLGKAWDKWGKDAAAELPFATKGMKAAKIDRAKEKKDKKISDAQKIADDPDSSAKDKKDAEKVLDKEMSAVDKAERETGKKEKEKGDTEKIEKGKVATGEYSTDKAGIIDNQGDAQKYREATGSAPEGWATSDGKTPEGAAPKPAKGIVWTSDDEEKWKEIISMIDYNFYHPNSFMTCTELWEGEGLIEENKGLYEITGDKGGHPTPISHKLFAEELYKCIKEKF